MNEVSLPLSSPVARPLGDARRMARGVDLASRERRQSTSKETLEMMVYVDKQTADYYGSTSSVETHVLTMLNVVSCRDNERV